VALRDTRFKWLNKPLLGSQLDPDWASEYGIVGYWLFNENGGTRINDLSPNRFAGALKNFASPGWAGGQNGSVLAFDGTDDYVDMGSASQSGALNFNNQDFSFFLRAASSSNGGFLLSKTDGPGGNGYDFAYNLGGNNGQWGWRTNSADTCQVTSGNYSDGNFHLAVCTYRVRDSSLALYLDGPIAATANGTITGNSAAPLQFGARNGANIVVASKIDFVGICNKTLTLDQSTRLYANPYAGILPPTTRRWFVGVTGGASGIIFDAASNSGYQSAQSTYSWSHTCTGSNGFLAVDVSLLSIPGTTVTSITYNGVNLTRIGVQYTSTAIGGVECWGIANPATGSHTITVTLSASIISSGEAVSYTGVDQTEPTEEFESTFATNGVSATDASVIVTPVADNCWIHGAIATTDGSITANQTSRNNVTGAAGSGGNEDSNAAIHPATGTATSWTGIGALQTWAIAGYAIRPVGDPITVTMDFGGPIEWLALVQKDYTQPEEYLVSLQSDFTVPEEHLVNPQSDSAMSEEYFLSLQSDSTLPEEHTVLVSNDTTLKLEWSLLFQADSPLPLEHPTSAITDAVMPEEWGGSVGVTVDSLAPLEWPATIRKDVTQSIEHLVSVIAQGNTEPTWAFTPGFTGQCAASFNQSWILQTENGTVFTQTIGGSSATLDVSIPRLTLTNGFQTVIYLGSSWNANGPTNDLSLDSTGCTGGTPATMTLTLGSVEHLPVQPVEWLVGRQQDTAQFLEHLVSVRVDSPMRVEWLQLATAIFSDSSTPMEWLSSGVEIVRSSTWTSSPTPAWAGQTVIVPSGWTSEPGP
jgi:hypothetical protein